MMSFKEINGKVKKIWEEEQKKFIMNMNIIINASLKKSQLPTENMLTKLATDLINKKHEKKKKRNIWNESKWKFINHLENDDVGGVGEEIIDKWCKVAFIDSDINGKKTKKIGGGVGDGTISGRTCEIKTARLGSDRINLFISYK